MYVGHIDFIMSSCPQNIKAKKGLLSIVARIQME